MVQWNSGRPWMGCYPETRHQRALNDAKGCLNREGMLHISNSSWNKQKLVTGISLKLSIDGFKLYKI